MLELESKRKVAGFQAFNLQSVLFLSGSHEWHKRHSSGQSPETLCGASMKQAILIILMVSQRSRLFRWVISAKLNSCYMLLVSTRCSGHPGGQDLKEAIRELLQWPEDHKVLLKRRDGHAGHAGLYFARFPSFSSFPLG